MKLLLPFIVCSCLSANAQQYEMPAKVAGDQLFYAAQTRREHTELGETFLKKKD
jgi:hypothetical protein